MRHIIFVTVISLLCVCSSAQVSLDMNKIYEAVIGALADKNLPIANETFTKIYKYDIDGDLNNWFYRRSSKISSDSSQILVTSICVLPIQYSQTVVSFLYSKATPVDTNDLLNQADNTTVNSLTAYISNKRLVSWKRAPLANSAIENLFKKKKVIGLSNILLDKNNNIALVKMQVYSKKKLRSENPSRLFILNKVGVDWIIVGMLEEKR